MNSLSRVSFTNARYTKRALRFQKARERLRSRKASEITKERAVQYVTSAFVMAMNELYGWAEVRSGRAVAQALEKWGSYTKEEEHKLLDGARNVGVDVEEVTQMVVTNETPKGMNMTKQTFKNYMDAITDVHLMFASLLIVLHDEHRFGDIRLNKVMNHMWLAWQKCREDDGRSIMQMCEEQTGICVEGGV